MGQDSDAHDFFEKQQSQADNAELKTRTMFFRMMLRIADQLDAETMALSLPQNTPRAPAFLNLCMAPGGFAKAALTRNHRVRVRGRSLPASAGGHEFLITSWERDARLAVRFLDITMLAAEMGVADIPADHPWARYLPRRGFRPGLLRRAAAAAHIRPVWRTSPRDAGRLATAQLVLALQRILAGGTLVVLPHKPDAWRSVELLHQERGFAGAVALFKPVPMHAKKSPFYLVAKGV